MDAETPRPVGPEPEPELVHPADGRAEPAADGDGAAASGEPEPGAPSGLEVTSSFEPGGRTGMMTTMVGVAGRSGDDCEGLGDRDRPVDLDFLDRSTKLRSLGRVGRYEVLGLVGRGGMGLVFRAFDPRLRRVVAVKVLAPDLARCERARRRFVREARAAASIAHPNVVACLAVGSHRGLPFLVMEYVRGRTLCHRIKAEGRLPAAEAARIAADVAAGLAAAHAAGVVHRDVNPANILIDARTGRVRVADFGLARALEATSGLTSADRVLGTPAYMAPEQARGEPVDPRSDLFGLGGVLYAMLVGRSPFGGGHPLQVVRRVCDDGPSPPSAEAADCPPGLSDVVMRLLAKRPDDRFGSAAEVIAALRPYLSAGGRTGSGANGESTDRADGEVTQPFEPAAPALSPPPPPDLAPSATAAVAEGTTPDPVAIGLDYGRPVREVLIVSAFVALAVVAWPALRPPERAAGVGAVAVRSGAGASPPKVASRDGVRGPAVLTVGRADGTDFDDLASAMARAGPGDTIRLRDDGPFDGPLQIDDPDRWRGLTIEGAPGVRPTLRAAGVEAVVRVVDTPGVTLRRLRIDPEPEQFAVRADGRLDGLTLDDIESRKGPDALRAHVFLTPGARGTADRPIVVRGGRFEGGHQGLVLEGSAARPVEHVRVVENLFLDLGQHVELLQNLHDVSVCDNRLAGGAAGLWVNLPSGRGCEVRICHNSLIGLRHWLHPADSEPSQDRLVVRRNAILRPVGDLGDAPLLPMAEGWTFEANLREARPGAGPESPAACDVPELAVVCRDPADPDFLRPAEGSALRTHGWQADPDAIVGARPAGWERARSKK